MFWLSWISEWIRNQEIFKDVQPNPIFLTSKVFLIILETIFALGYDIEDLNALSMNERDWLKLYQTSHHVGRLNNKIFV